MTQPAHLPPLSNIERKRWESQTIYEFCTEPICIVLTAYYTQKGGYPWPYEDRVMWAYGLPLWNVENCLFRDCLDLFILQYWTYSFSIVTIVFQF